MRILPVAAALLGLTGAASMLHAATVLRYTIEGSSSATAKVAFFGLASKSARFDDISGRVSFTPGDMKTLDINVAIDASKLKAGDGVTLKRLKGKDFFWVEKYPTVTFSGENLTMKTATTGSISGNLTARGIKKPVQMAVTFSKAPAQAIGNERIALTGQTTINRKDFGMTAYSGIVGKKVKITINAKLVGAN